MQEHPGEGQTDVDGLRETVERKGAVRVKRAAPVCCDEEEGWTANYW